MINLQTFSDTGYPIFLDVISNLGFIALTFSVIIPLNYMGLLMVLAMLSTSLGTLVILFSLIGIINEKLITNYSFVVAGVIEVVARPATKLAFAIPPST